MVSDQQACLTTILGKCCHTILVDSEKLICILYVFLDEISSRSYKGKWSEQQFHSLK